MHAAKAKRTVEEVLRCVVAQDFDTLLQIAPGSRMTAEDLRTALADYHREPIMPVAPVEELFDVVEVHGSSPASWSVGLPLWTKEEGRSDLTLEMRFIDSDADLYTIEIEDLHV